jgi:kynurenine formamidase
MPLAMRQLFPLLLLIVAGCKQADNPVTTASNKPLPDNVNWIDLSYTFDSSTLYWPNNTKPYVHSTDAAGVTAKGYYYSSYTLCTPEHGGTHLDAPVHFAEKHWSVDQIPLQSLTGHAIVVDISGYALPNHDYLLSIEDLKRWEQDNGRIADSTIVLVRTGFGQFYPNRERYFGTAKTGAAALTDLHFPGIDPLAAQWLVKERKVKAVGLDTPSLDFGQSADFKTHQVLMGANVPGFENLANLDKLPAAGAYIVALPMKIGGGSGGPLRIIAAIP